MAERSRPLGKLLARGILCVLSATVSEQAAAVPKKLQDYNPSRLIRFTTPEQAEAKRRELVRFIWPDGLPVRSLPTVAASIDRQVFSEELAGVDASLAGAVDRLDVDVAPFGFHSICYLIHPVADSRSNRRLVVFHPGHRRDGPLGTTYVDAIDRLLVEGFVVLVIDMPLTGWNKDSTIKLPGSSATLTIKGRRTAAHNDMFRQLRGKLPGGAAFRSFLEPVVQGINHFVHAHADAIDVSMVGLSGGGWTTHMAAAIDRRIRLSFPVAGVYPLYARPFARGSRGDEEQWHAPLYGEVDSDGDGIADAAVGVASWLEIFVLGGFGERRRQVQVLNFEDSCCSSAPMCTRRTTTSSPASSPSSARAIGTSTRIAHTKATSSRSTF